MYFVIKSLIFIIELYYKGLKNAGLLIELHAFILPNLPLFAAGLAPPLTCGPAVCPLNVFRVCVRKLMFVWLQPLLRCEMRVDRAGPV